MTVATAPHPIVRFAKKGLIALRSREPASSVRTVSSTSGRPFSPATISAARICPLSIMAPATTIEFRNPRHAFETSKTCAEAGSPILWWANEAEAGSSMSRDTAAWMKSPICSRVTDETPRTARPAAALASDGSVPSGHTGARGCPS
jgi:hypothetical protein